MSENVVMAYFTHLKESGNTKSGEGLKGSSRMSIMSRLKTYLLAKHGFNSNSKCWTTIARTIQDDRNQETPKQAKTFMQQQLDDFFTTAPNDDNWLVTKVAASVAIVCNRPSELYNMVGDDVKRLDDGGWEITVSKRKTQKRHAATFIVPRDVDGPTSPLRYLPAYMALRAEKQFDGQEPLFWQVRRGKMTKQRVGENSFNEMTKNMASFLELADAEQYTGYALRRSSATLAAENGANSMQMKTHFGWKNDKMANRYVDSTTKSKSDMSRLITGGGTKIGNAVPPTDIVAGATTSTTAAFSSLSSMFRPPMYAHEQQQQPQQQQQRSFLSELGSAFNFSNNGTVNIVFNVGSKKRTAGEDQEKEEPYTDDIDE